MSIGKFHEYGSEPADSVDQEAECEGRIQDIIAVMKSLMVEDADGNEELARETLLKAHRVANEARHWGELAKCWYHYFLDLEQVESCFFKARDIASAGPTVATVEYRTKEVAEDGRVVRHVIGPDGAHGCLPADVVCGSDVFAGRDR